VQCKAEQDRQANEAWKKRSRESLQAGMVRSRPRPRPAMGECAESGRRRHRKRISENERRSQYWTQELGGL